MATPKGTVQNVEVAPLVVLDPAPAALWPRLPDPQGAQAGRIQDPSVVLDRRGDPPVGGVGVCLRGQGGGAGRVLLFQLRQGTGDYKHLYFISKMIFLLVPEIRKPASWARLT